MTGKFWLDKKYNNVKISKHFNLREFACHGTGQVIIYTPLIKRLERLRKRLKRSIIVNSGFRTQYWNKRIGGSKKSTHKRGEGADVRSPGVTIKRLAVECKAVGFRCIIAHEKEGFVHVDERKSIFWVVPRGWF